MKIFSLLVFAFMLLSCNESQSKTLADSSKTTQQQDPKLKRYNIKSGIIKYEITIEGNVMGSEITGNGTEHLYFTDYGALELIEENSSQTTKTNVFGNKSTNTTDTHTMNKLANGESYSVDFKQKKIYKQKDLAMALTKQLQPNADAGKVGKDMLKSIGGEKTGSETYKGYNCEIWEAMGVKQWIYKGVTLKSVGRIMGITTTKTATNIEFNIDVAENNFTLPDYPIEKLESFLSDEEMDNDFDSEEVEDMDAKLKMIQNLSYEDWKKQATLNDEEMGEMSDAELRETYDMIQKVIKMREQ
jgi:hypothetical protein